MMRYIKLFVFIAAIWAGCFFYPKVTITVVCILVLIGFGRLIYYSRKNAAK